MSDQPTPPRNAPNPAFEKARRIWFENYGSSIVEKKRYFVLAVVVGVALIAQSIAIWTMLPLKTVVPYVVTVEKLTGRVSVEDATAQRYKPGAPEQRYFLAQWVTKLLLIDRNLTERYLPQAYKLCRDKAIQQFIKWNNDDRPLERVTKDGTLTRTVTIKSISFIQEGAAIIRLSTEERGGGAELKVKSFAITVHYALVPPEDERVMLDNPIGLYVTHFGFSEDLS